MDVDRAAVYAAELVAFDGTDLEMPVSFDVIDAAVRSVVAGPWWPGPAVRCVAARSDARSSSARHDAKDRDVAVLRFASTQLTIATAAHELAHALAGPDRGHDPVFRVALLDIVGVITNRHSHDRRADLHVRQLNDAFVAADLTVGERGWPAPPGSISGGAIAL